MAELREIDDQLWVYVITDGHLVTGYEPAMATDYEKVDD